MRPQSQLRALAGPCPALGRPAVRHSRTPLPKPSEAATHAPRRPSESSCSGAR